VQPDDVPCCVDRDALNIEIHSIKFEIVSVWFTWPVLQIRFWKLSEKLNTNINIMLFAWLGPHYIFNSEDAKLNLHVTFFVRFSLSPNVMLEINKTLYLYLRPMCCTNCFDLEWNKRW
jgi:hypothetical protein